MWVKINVYTLSKKLSQKSEYVILSLWYTRSHNQISFIKAFDCESALLVCCLAPRAFCIYRLFVTYVCAWDRILSYKVHTEYYIHINIGICNG